MAIQTLTSAGSFSKLSISGQTSKAGNMSWSLPTLPAGATITGTTLTATLTVSMSRGSATVTINGKSYTASSPLSFDLGTTTKTSLAVSAKGATRNANGTVSISNIVYTITYEDGQGSSKYTVRFLDATGNAISTQEIAHGSSATPPELPVTNGYLYLGWNGGYTNITQDTDITANYVQEQGTPSNNALSLNWSVMYGATIIQATKHSIAIRVTEDWGGVSVPYPDSFKGKDIPFSISSSTLNDGYVIIYNEDTLSNIAVMCWDELKATVNVPTGVNATIRFTAEFPGIIYVTDLCAIDNSVPPVINIRSQDVTKISRVSGYDRCTVTFIADQELTYWEARATTLSQTPAHGVGLLVESGTLAKGETGYIYVDDEELTNGDLQYRIDIYGRNSSGVWSDD